ncbi:MAG: adenylate/guanylate cyclase domain-containing protein [Phycisphaerae bacterium]
MTDSKAVLKSFLFTDLVGSTELKQRLGDAQAAAIIDRHDKLFRQCLKRFGGSEEVNPGDEFFATFGLPSDAVRCALAFVKGLAELDVAESVKVRVGIHMGETTQLETTESGRPKLVGLAVDTAARVMGVAQPRQILLTRHAFDSVRQHVGKGPDDSPVKWLAHGRYLFKGVEDPLEVFEAGVEGVSPLNPPPSSEKARRILAPGDEETLGWRPAVGLTVPGRPGWTLERNLGAGGFGEV